MGHALARGAYAQKVGTLPALTFRLPTLRIGCARAPTLFSHWLFEM